LLYQLIFILLLGDGSIGLEEFRYDCVNRMPVAAVEMLDDAFRYDFTLTLTVRSDVASH
jgi:hypothetical protein